MQKIGIKKRAVTLIEMMIVMFLIALITGVVAYNYRGSLDEGKAFKSKAGIEKLETILNLAAADDSSVMDSLSGTQWQKYVLASPLVQNPKSLIKDGWGDDYKVEVRNNMIVVYSDKYNDYKKSHKSMFSDDDKQN